MPEETKLKPTREHRIEMAKRYAPQNAVQEREGLAIGELVTVNADMISLLHEDMEEWKAKAEALSELERLAREVLESYYSDPDNRGEFPTPEMQDRITALSAHFAEQDKIL